MIINAICGKSIRASGHIFSWRRQLKNHIEELRKERRLTQQELADAVGVTRQTIISLERGKYIASLTLAFRLSHYFGKTIEDIFEEDE
jgi:Predicted transcriptional regulators